MRSPSARVSAAQPSQSPSATPSSIEMIGYWRHQSVYISTICSGVRVGSPDLRKTYLPLSHNSLEATSSARNTSWPALSPTLATASSTTSSASRFDLRFGANPPPPQLPVKAPALLRIDLRA